MYPHSFPSFNFGVSLFFSIRPLYFVEQITLSLLLYALPDAPAIAGVSPPYLYIYYILQNWREGKDRKVTVLISI
jgi:hypothetical protein